MTYDIQNYGALPNGELCTRQIQSAIDDCFLNGGGVVAIPEGVYLTGGLRLRSGVALHLYENAVLLGSTSPEDSTTYLDDRIEPISEDERQSPVSTVKAGESVGSSAYPYSRWNNAIIRAIGAKGIAIIGERGSEINGQNCFDPEGEEGYRGPHAINMWFCEDVTLRGYTVRDSGNWAHAIHNSRDISIKEVTVLGGHDGFDARTCDDISVENCTFKTGDDCIAGFDNINVMVRDCYFESSCSIFRFGATNMVVEGCRGVAPATYGFRGHLSSEEKSARAYTTEKCRHSCLNVFLYYCDYRADVRRTPGNIVVRNCSFKSPDAILSHPFGHKWCCNRALDNITFENCVFDGICKPINLECPEDTPLSLYMRDCAVACREGYSDINFIVGNNVATVELERISFENLKTPKIICTPNVKVSIT